MITIINIVALASFVFSSIFFGAILLALIYALIARAKISIRLGYSFAAILFLFIWPIIYYFVK